MQRHEKILDKTRSVDYLDREILTQEMKLDDLKRKKSYFIEQYNQHLTLIPVLNIENEWLAYWPLTRVIAQSNEHYGRKYFIEVM